MKHLLHRNTFLLFLILAALTGCRKKPFYEDLDDPGLSRFTNRGYNLASAYINQQPWQCGYDSYFNDASILLDTNTSAKDTLSIIWQGRFNVSNPLPPTTRMYYPYVIISMPVKNGFNRNDFLNWNNKLFPADTTTVTISMSDVPIVTGRAISGTGRIYFVNVLSKQDNRNKVQLHVAGLFEGNIGDSVKITKGRFDYIISDHNLK
jgi:hypothetical protein